MRRLASVPAPTAELKPDFFAEFASQKLPPPPATLALAYALLQEHARSPVGEGRSADAELMAFYNCGPLSGASQPHCHVQFIECSLEAGETEDMLGKRGEGRVPVERLLHTCVEQEGRDGESQRRCLESTALTLRLRRLHLRAATAVPALCRSPVTS